jgi:hypothetical protein
MLPHPNLQPDRRKARGPFRPKQSAHVPKYTGRWPFIGVPSQLETRVENGASPKTRVHAAPAAGPPDSAASTIRRNPLVAIGIAAAVGFVLALAFSERG